jgi:hypothetical protein
MVHGGLPVDVDTADHFAGFVLYPLDDVHVFHETTKMVVNFLQFSLSKRECGGRERSTSRDSRNEGDDQAHGEELLGMTYRP